MKRARRSSWSRTRPTSLPGPAGRCACATATSSRTKQRAGAASGIPPPFSPTRPMVQPTAQRQFEKPFRRIPPMRFLETLLYIGSVLFVIGYLVMLGVTLRNDKGRRTLILALRSLWLHKMRAMLSVLGIIIGTAAVISLMAFREGSIQDALEDSKPLASTNTIAPRVQPPHEIR